MRIRTTTVAFAVTALVASTVAGASVGIPAALAAKPAKHCTPSWKLVPVPETPGYVKELTGVTALPGGDAWIAGQEDLPTSFPFTLHGDGSSISLGTPMPHPADFGTMMSQGAAQSFSSDTDGWRLTDVNFVQTAERWHGGRWTMTPLPTSPDPRTTQFQMGDVASLAADDAWAVGGLFSSGAIGLGGLGAVIEHWDGTTWSVVPNPAADRDNTTFRGMHAVSATDIWAVGYQGDASTDIAVPLIEHYDGTAWREVPADTSPAINGPAGFLVISVSGPDDVWAAGSQTIPNTSNTAGTLVEHYDGTAWTAVTDLPDLGNARILQIYAASRSDVWAIAEVPDGAYTFLHFDGSTWTATQSPSRQALGYRVYYQGLSGTGSGDVWAVGEITDFGNGREIPQVAHLSCGTS